MLGILYWKIKTTTCLLIMKMMGINARESKWVIYTKFNSDGGDVWQFKACLPCLEYVKENDISLSDE